MAEPVYDVNGREIFQGDLLRSPHFRGARGKRYWLYHVAVWSEEHQCLEAVPPVYLDPGHAKRRITGGGCYWLHQDNVDTAGCEIINGYGPPGQHWPWDERKKVQLAELQAKAKGGGE